MQEEVAEAREKQAVVIIVPTYNNAKTLVRVLDGIHAYTNRIIVVNDGSTDGTADILLRYPGLHIITFAQNKGKGAALRAGIAKARKQDYDYAISIDSDGQHFPTDIPAFNEVLQQATKPVLLIGSRNMNHDSVPRKSSFGNRFSNFWFWFETGIKLTDTQSGFRAYPLKAISKKFYTKKFEFEIEIIVRAAWRGIEVRNIPIQVLYDPAERVSHFRPFKDFTRISILNTVLVFLTFFYILPRNFFRSFKKKNLKDFIKQNILGSQDSPEKKALSIGLGVFMGIAPVWGFQTAITITLAVFLRLNKVLAFAFSNISFAPFIPVVIYASLLVGGLLYPSDATLDLDRITMDTVKSHLWQYIVGSIILAAGMSVLIGFSSYFFMKVNQQRTISTR
jgi:glycosyltransferase involved in cell wall biosynthesis